MNKVLQFRPKIQPTWSPMAQKPLTRQEYAYRARLRLESRRVFRRAYILARFDIRVPENEANILLIHANRLAQDIRAMIAKAPRKVVA